METLYRGSSGQWAHLLHRISGFLVVFFLLLHIVDVSLINFDRRLYNEVHALYGNVFLRIFEIGLLAALVFHALNGIRVIAVNASRRVARYQEHMFAFVLFVTVASTIAGGYVILHPFLEGKIL